MASYMDDFISGGKKAIPNVLTDIYKGGQNIRRRGIVPVAKEVGQQLVESGGNLVQKVAYGQEGNPAVKPVTSTPSMDALSQRSVGGLANTGYLPQNWLNPAKSNKDFAAGLASKSTGIVTRTPQAEGVGAGVIPRVGPTIGGAQVIMAANQSTQQDGRGIINGKQTAGIPFRNSTMDEVEKAKADYAKFMGTPQNTESYQDRMARWRSETGPYNPREREATRVAQARQAAQTEQANVAGEREAGVERFKATEAARGAIGSKEAAAEGATAGIRLEGEYKVKAAEAKAGASEGKDRAKMLKDYSMTLANSEPGSPAYQAAEAGLAELYGQKAGAIPQAAIELLKKNPSAKAQFEAKYGAGSAAQYIKG